MSDRGFWWAAGGVLLLAMLLRLGIVLFFAPAENAVGDSLEFSMLAQHVLEGHGLSYGEPWLPSARRTPLYPLVLAATYRLFGLGNTQPALLLQVLADVAVVALVGWLAWRAWGDRRVGLIAALGWALYLPGAQLAGRLLADSLFTFLLLAGTTLFVMAGDRLVRGRRGLLWALFSGALLGMSALARPTSLPLTGLLGLLLLLWYYLRHSQTTHGGVPSPPPRHRGRSMGRREPVPAGEVPPASRVWLLVAVALAGSVLVLLPWFVRNYNAFGRLVTGSTLLGYNLYQTHFRLDQPDYWLLPGVPATNEALKAALRSDGIEPTALNEVELYDEAMARGLVMVRRYPARFLSLVGLRSIQFWFNLGFTSRPSLATLAFAAANAMLILLAVYAEVWCLRRCRLQGSASLIDLVPFLVHSSAIAILLYFTISHGLVIAAGRYAVPAVPFLLVLASGTALSMFHWGEEDVYRE